ncbi:lipase secretion chaperone [Parachitinimonas caeni]|uniref:Lipase helper protein n=1 Tax=Parachitinimonas caeni TaxID=3031301 RepID=A0ABT7DSI1_9NEIS|nr:lipase secretion chaperone [Parachitinimonas caeni]MDK2123019.1 lipase secretion chaperone [Parachitinimonas caeni]
MKRNAQVLLASSLVAALGLVGWNWLEASPPADWPTRPATVSPQNQSGASPPAASAVSPSRQTATDPEDWGSPAYRQTQLQSVLAGKRSLLPVLREAEITCRFDAHCAGWPNADIARLPAAEAVRLQKALAARSAIEQKLAELVQRTDRPLAARLAAISTARRSVAGEEVAQLLYGEEEAQIRFTAAARQFVATEAAKLSQKQRQEQLDTLRRQHYGPYFDQLYRNESSEDRLYWSLKVAEAGVSSEEKAALRFQMRRDYLGDAMAQTLARQDANDRSHAEKMAGYQRDRAALLAELRQRGDLDSDRQLAAELETRLEALRKRWFG